MAAKTTQLSRFIKHKRKTLGITQKDLALKAGVGLRFIRDLEQGKPSLRVDKVNLVLFLFGHALEPVQIQRGTFDEKR